jgi:hypothetical protein
MGLAVALRFRMLSRKAFFFEGFSMVVDFVTGAGAGFATLFVGFFATVFVGFFATGFVGFFATTLTGTLATTFTGGRAFGLTDGFAITLGRGVGLEVLAVGFCGFLFFLAMGVLEGY